MQRTVLVVDDDPDSLQVLSKIMEKAEYRVVTAISGAECMDVLQRQTPDLILLDVMLPDVSGTDLCVTIRNDSAFNDTVIFLISGVKIASADHSFGLEIGADDYINRPFQSRELLARINSIFRLKESAVRKREASPYQAFDRSNTELTAAIFGQRSLKQGYPDEFKKQVERYTAIMQAAIEERFYKTSNNVSEQTKELSVQLGFLQAGAKDVIDIHQETLKGMMNLNSGLRAFYIKEESRILLLELMGYLLNFYRTRN
jgi:DNA-binding response OmpR family regulator